MGFDLKTSRAIDGDFPEIQLESAIVPGKSLDGTGAYTNHK